MYLGKAMQVINFQTVKNKPSKLSINENCFREVLQTSGDLPVYFLSVTGAASQGKSFLLNVVVLYLAALERGEEDPWKSVLDCKDMSAFSFGTNVEEKTVGFWMWPRPFILEKCEGEGNMAVFVVDTQGVFDQQTSPRDCAMILGLTFLTSSCVIYNLMNNMQEDTLAALETFVDFSQLSSGGKLFQKLLFLIRDWNIPDQFPYGGVGGTEFIQWKLDTQNVAPEFRAIREKINCFFQKKECFLMPPPGENVKSPSFRGDISTLEPQFQTHLRTFLENHLNPEGMVPMTLNGDRLMTGVDMFHYFDKYVKALNSAKFPQPYQNRMDTAKEAEISMLMSECKDKFQSILDSKMKESESGFLSNIRMKQFLEASSASTLSDFQNRLEDLRYSDSKKAARFVKLLAFDIKTQGEFSAKENAKKKDDFVSKILRQVEKDVIYFLKRASYPGAWSPEEFSLKRDQAIMSAVEVIEQAQADPDIASEMEAKFFSSLADRLEEFEATVKTVYANGKELHEKALSKAHKRSDTQEIETLFETVMEHHQNRESASHEIVHGAVAAVADFRNELTEDNGLHAVKSWADLAEKLQGQNLSTAAKHVAQVFTKEKAESFVQVLRSLIAEIVVDAKQNLEPQINANADAIKHKISDLSRQHQTQLCELMNSATKLNEDILSSAHREKLEGHILEFTAFIEKFPLVQGNKCWKVELFKAMGQVFLDVKRRFLERKERVKNTCDIFYNHVVSDYTKKMTRLLNQAKYHDEVYVHEQNRNFVLAALEEVDRLSYDSSGELNATELEGLRVRIEAKLEKDFQKMLLTLITKWETFKSNTRRFRLTQLKEFQRVAESPPVSFEDDMVYDSWLGREMEGHLTAFKNKFLAERSLLGSREMQLFEDDLCKMRTKLFNRFDTIATKSAVTQRYRNLMELEMSKSSNLTSSELERIHIKISNEMLNCRVTVDTDIDSNTLRSWFHLELGRIKECMTPIVDMEKTPQCLPKPVKRNSFTRKPFNLRARNIGAVQLPVINDGPKSPQADLDSVSLCFSVSADKENAVVSDMDNEQAEPFFISYSQ